MASSESSSTDLLLVGKTGNGKSATGNSILRKRAFVSKSSTTSVTTDVKRDTSVIDGKTVSVTDIPGLLDTAYNKEENFDMARNAMKEAVEMLPGGFSAIIIVLCFGGRFTKEDQDTIKIIKSILGYSVVEDHCICVITRGDNFEVELENDEDFKSFDEWCAQQTGELRELLDECLYRCVLFDNMTRDETKLCAQRDMLMSIVEDMRSRQSKGFGLAEFHLATQEQELREIVEEIPELEREGRTLIAEVRIERTQILRNEQGRGRAGRQSELQALKVRLENHRARLEKRDGGTGLLHDLISYVKREECRILSENPRRRRHRNVLPQNN